MSILDSSSTIVIPVTALVAVVLWMIKLAVEEALKDRRSRRETREQMARAQIAAFQAHVDECNARAATHARLEQKVDGITSSLSETKSALDKRTERVDEVFNQLIEHINLDQAWQAKLDEKLQELKAS